MKNRIFDKRLRNHHKALSRFKSYYKQDIDTNEYFYKVINEEARNKRVMYIHVPFCKKICSFCPFNTNIELKIKDYDNYLIDEIDKIKDYKYFKREMDSIYFGGGTPTALKAHQFFNIMDKIHKSFTIRKNAEISVESSISELDDKMIEVFKKTGVNRVSIGIQTFDKKIRKIFNRRAKEKEIFSTISKLKEAGIQNVNIDLIYNSPYHTMEILENDLEKIASLNLAGISFYALNIHQGTPLSTILSLKDIQKMSDIDFEFNQYNRVIEYLKPYGYKMFEFTKLIRDDIDKYEYITYKHDMGDCIPLGYGSAGNIENYYIGKKRGKNYFNDLPFIKDSNVYSTSYQLLDKFVYALQRSEIDFLEYSELYKLDLFEIFKDELLKYEDNGLIKIDKKIIFTKKGAFFGHNIINELVDKLNEYI